MNIARDCANKAADALFTEGLKGQISFSEVMEPIIATALAAATEELRAALKEIIAMPATLKDFRANNFCHVDLPSRMRERARAALEKTEANL